MIGKLSDLLTHRPLASIFLPALAIVVIPALAIVVIPALAILVIPALATSAYLSASHLPTIF